MGFTIVKKINLDNIKIVESYYTYTILYRLPYITLSGIPFQLTDIIIERVNNHYKITLTNAKNIQLMRTIEDKILSNISNYTPILKTDTKSYILLKQNPIVNSILGSKTSLSIISINIFKIKKYASHSYPLVYIL
jgi:hypothetical protein